MQQHRAHKTRVKPSCATLSAHVVCPSNRALVDDTVLFSSGIRNADESWAGDRGQNITQGDVGGLAATGSGFRYSQACHDAREAGGGDRLCPDEVMDVAEA